VETRLIHYPILGTVFFAVLPRSDETPQAPAVEAQPSTAAEVEGNPSERLATSAANVAPEPSGTKFEVVGAARSAQSGK
jgi:hypothetical protein